MTLQELINDAEKIQGAEITRTTLIGGLSFEAADAIAHKLQGLLAFPSRYTVEACAHFGQFLIRIEEYPEN